MKIRTLFLSMVAGLAFVGCSSEEDTTSGTDNGNNGEPQFLTVSVNATSTLTRADVPGEYEEGLSKENAVSKVRFYFFDEDNNAAAVKNGTPKTYYDVENLGVRDDNDMENVEKILKATLVIHTKDGDKIPTSIIAVVNPTTTLGEVADINALNKIVADYSSTESFIMSSSVYAKDEGAATAVKMEAVDVTGHLYSTEDAAKQDPVVIHVERVLAKARLNVGVEKVANKDYYKTSTDGSQKYGDEEIFVQFLGWNVTATAKTSRLMKEINPAWSKTLFSESLLWNTADYYRSFWAVNPENMEYNYGPFNTDNNKFAANAIKYFDKGTEEKPTENYTYLQENASDSYDNGTNPETPSQVIIAAQLVDGSGSPLTFAEYGGERTTIDGLKAKYAAAAGLWTNKEGEGAAGKRGIDVNDIELKSTYDIVGGDDYQETKQRYKVYAQLTTAAAEKTWYSSDAENAEPVNANDVLKKLGGAKVWEKGYTYYYFDIRHLNGVAPAADAKGKYGVVRNHIYDAKITSLAGLGTPVYDPDEVIYPEKPEDDDTFIAAEVRILSWRVVEQNIELEW